MSQNARPSQWEDLLKQAYKIIDHVNREQDLLTSWTFGGGTAMMLQINHRESHDVDLFLDDPQLLSYITASVADLDFEIGRPTYGGDGASHLKVAFEDIGEIDFIVAGHIVDHNAESTNLLGRTIDLETIPEIIGKKIRFRGSSIEPRDIFDIAAASKAGYDEQIAAALEEIADYRNIAADRLNQLKPEYVNSVIAQLMLKPEFEATAKDAITIATRLLRP
ncbi:nucleotidyl transferase AbiEii/AbiGii toxin family protein [Yoonia sp. R2-816]|uniref:nucleotidyl transferase AbiEii/AbiGii toxin family protein n=1 Tax=Yoonia sp. R2-816 TaxID=3342638 RepID=UPI00372C0B30